MQQDPQLSPVSANNQVVSFHHVLVGDAEVQHHFVGRLRADT
jgi:hypothetical protein